ncbi:hypothetical protein [Lactobacillus johnsonii]|uniref:hypothetical protein n=1 Tax=Lactobacillus johnsonii TaxID=33959 RepID=UPI0012F7AE4E|nr:hypothetical protein [Lactobacillus johnsonii]
MMQTQTRQLLLNLVHATKDIKPTPTEDTTVTYTFYDETDKKPVEGHDVTVTGQSWY